MHGKLKLSMRRSKAVGHTVFERYENTKTTRGLRARYRGESQTVHFVAPPGLLNMQTEHVHESPAGFGGGFIPAFDQSKPCVTGLGVSARGASHTVHLSAPPGLLSMHTEQLQVSAAGFGGGFIPAACQLNPPDVE